jgi:hypothetical protein
MNPTFLSRAALYLGVAAFSTSFIQAGSAVAGGKGPASGGNASDAAAASTNLWEVSAAAGLGLTRGNVDSMNLGVQVLATYVDGSNVPRCRLLFQRNRRC